MLRLGAEAWELIDIPELTPRSGTILSQIDSNNIVILGGFNTINYNDLSDGVVLNTQTGAVRVIDPISENTFTCESQSFMKTAGEIVSLVKTSSGEVHIICYNQADDAIYTLYKL